MTGVEQLRYYFRSATREPRQEPIVHDKKVNYG